MSVIFQDDKFILHNGDGSEEKVLLDIARLTDNKSRLPLQFLSDRDSIPKVILELAKSHDGISGGEGEGQYTAYVLDIIFISYLMRSSLPARVLEIGAVDGVMSYHLAVIMGKLNSESSLCCVSNVIGNESGNHWIDRISMVSHPPGLSMVVADYSCTQLASDNFDVIVIHNIEGAGEVHEIMAEARRMIKGKGVVICHASYNSVTMNEFKKVFAGCKEYVLSSVESIFVSDNPHEGECDDKEPSLSEEMRELNMRLDDIIKEGDSGAPENIRPVIGIINRLTDRAVAERDIDSKVILIELKEMVIDYMINRDDEFHEYYKSRLRDYNSGLLSQSEKTPTS